MKSLLLSIVIVLFLVSSSFASGGSIPDDNNDDSNDDPTATLEVEINTGPVFTEDDPYQIQYCTEDYYWAFFPMDFLFNGNIPSSSNECPNIEFYGYSQDLCWVLDIYRTVSPGISLALIIYSIFHL